MFRHGLHSLGGKIRFFAEKMPWRAEAIEPEAGVFRRKTGFKSGTSDQPPSEPEYVDIHFICEGVTAPILFGETNPKILNNGLTIGTVPGELEFTPGAAGESELESELLGFWEPAGNVKVQGYANQALLEVHNP